MSKLVKKQLKKRDDNETNGKTRRTLQYRLKLKNKWNILYIPEELKPKILKQKTLVVSSTARPEKNENFFQFIKRLYLNDEAFLVYDSNIIHFNDLMRLFEENIDGNVSNIML